MHRCKMYIDDTLVVWLSVLATFLWRFLTKVVEREKVP